MRYNEYEYTPVPIGKYKGRYLREVPTTYIKWAITNLQDRGLAEMFALELQRREPTYRASLTKTV